VKSPTNWTLNPTTQCACTICPPSPARSASRRHCSANCSRLRVVRADDRHDRQPEQHAAEQLVVAQLLAQILRAQMGATVSVAAKPLTVISDGPRVICSRSSCRARSGESGYTLVHLQPAAAESNRFLVGEDPGGVPGGGEEVLGRRGASRAPPGTGTPAQTRWSNSRRP
jgi:hypothetical protein